MNCPVCKTTDLTMTERQGVEIDYCPQCRGIWLDRGELDKLLERSHTQPPPQLRDYPEELGREYHHHDRHSTPYDHRRKKSWLEELFD